MLRSEADSLEDKLGIKFDFLKSIGLNRRVSSSSSSFPTPSIAMNKPHPSMHNRFDGGPSAVELEDFERTCYSDEEVGEQADHSKNIKNSGNFNSFFILTY